MAVGKRSVDGVRIDATYQPISEAPYWQGEGETIDVVDDEAVGEETTEGEIDFDPTPETSGQTTLDEWRWSA